MGLPMEGERQGQDVLEVPRRGGKAAAVGQAVGVQGNQDVGPNTPETDGGPEGGQNEAAVPRLFRAVGARLRKSRSGKRLNDVSRLLYMTREVCWNKRGLRKSGENVDQGAS